MRAIVGSSHYVVLEGNRRVTALRSLKDAGQLSSSLLASVDPLEVMEIVDNCSDTDLRAKISYLLGVRHHGSLKQWSPFAQAHHIYGRYLHEAGLTHDTFEWFDPPGEAVAKTLSIKPKEVKDRVLVYRVMRQVDAMPSVKEVGGIKGHYFTLCQEVLNRPKKSPLRSYIQLDPNTFLLSPDSLERLDNLCHFSTPSRAKAPIKTFQEWRYFDKILKEEDKAKLEEMKTRVEQDKVQPSLVWAERAAELSVPRWDTWLEEVALLLGKAKVDDLGSLDERTINAARRLDALLQKLNSVQTGGA